MLLQAVWRPHHYFQVRPSHICSYSSSVVTLSLTNLSCNLERQKEIFKGVSLPQLNVKQRRQHADNYGQQQCWIKGKLYSYIPNIFFLLCINHQQMRPKHMSLFHFKTLS